NASIVSSIERSSLVFTIIFAIIFLKEEVNWKIITGAMLMIGGALMITLSQKTD
ncbi:MAG: EamA family transporter, partial [Chitinophagaceae bacterium]